MSDGLHTLDDAISIIANDRQLLIRVIEEADARFSANEIERALSQPAARLIMAIASLRPAEEWG